MYYVCIVIIRQSSPFLACVSNCTIIYLIVIFYAYLCFCHLSGVVSNLSCDLNVVPRSTMNTNGGPEINSEV